MFLNQLTAMNLLGHHIGRFYDENGRKTKVMKQFHEWVRQAEKQSEKEADLNKVFPPCNSEWKQGEGSRVWCTKQR